MAANPLVDAIDAEACYASLLDRLRHVLQPDDHLVGIQSKGVWVAKRLHGDLKLSTPMGVMSSSLHRDDFAIRGLVKADQTQLPFDLNNTSLVLVDDVLFTGRTVRATLNELFDFGRPKLIRLAVLVDRGGRELPIQADFSGLRMYMGADKKVSLKQLQNSHFEFVVNSGDA